MKTPNKKEQYKAYTQGTGRYGSFSSGNSVSEMPLKMDIVNNIMKNLNKTIHRFDYLGEPCEIDWLTDDTSIPDEKVCDIFLWRRGKGAGCAGQIIVKKGDSKKQIEKMAIAEISESEEV